MRYGSNYGEISGACCTRHFHDGLESVEASDSECDLEGESALRPGRVGKETIKRMAHSMIKIADGRNIAERCLS